MECFTDVAGCFLEVLWADSMWHVLGLLTKWSFGQDARRFCRCLNVKGRMRLRSPSPPFLSSPPCPCAEYWLIHSLGFWVSPCSCSIALRCILGSSELNARHYGRPSPLQHHGNEVVAMGRIEWIPYLCLYNVSLSQKQTGAVSSYVAF